MNEYLIQLLKLNILTLAAYNPALTIEDLLDIRWEDVQFQEQEVLLRINDKDILITEEYFNLFLRELYSQSSRKKTNYVFLQ